MASKRFGKFIAQVEEFDDGCSQCWVKCSGGYQSSLDAAKCDGGLENNTTDGFKPIDDNTLAKIEAWAYENGY